MQKSIGYVVWMQILNKFTCLKVSEIFTILLCNINNLKLVKKRKKLFLNRNFPKLQFTIESGLVRPFFCHKMY